MTNKKKQVQKKQVAYAVKNGVLHELNGTRYQPITDEKLRQEAAIRLLETTREIVRSFEHELEKTAPTPTEPTEGNMSKLCTDIALRITKSRKKLHDTCTQIVGKTIGLEVPYNEDILDEQPSGSIINKLHFVQGNLNSLEDMINNLSEFVANEI